MNDMFSSASLKLTAWYLLIIMLISLIFSGIIYQSASQQLGRGLQGGGPKIDALVRDPVLYEQLRQQRTQSARQELLMNLVIINASTLAVGGFASYALARRTLRPIRGAVEAQSRFTGDASHELRTPLAVMRTEIEVALRDETTKKSEMKQLLESNLEEVGSLQSLSENLLILADDSLLSLQAVGAVDVVQAATRIIKTRAKDKNIELLDEIKPASVKADTDSLTQLLVILLDNAIKYSHAGRKIVISGVATQKSYTFAVTDSGVGIETADIAHIFDRFYRADASRTASRVKGYGLGLSIAKRIADKHHTKLEVTSAPGKGSCFKFSLPIA